MHSTMLNVVNNSQNTHDICNISHCKDIYFRYRKVIEIRLYNNYSETSTQVLVNLITYFYNEKHSSNNLYYCSLLSAFEQPTHTRMHTKIQRERGRYIHNNYTTQRHSSFQLTNVN